MRTYMIFITKSILLLCMVTMILVSCSKSSDKGADKGNHVVAAYVTPSYTEIPNPQYVTHVNYAFGKVDMTTFDKVNINNIPVLQKLVDLKGKNPDLKVILSIGGWTAGGFSEMASDEQCRNSFIADCVDKCEKYNLDGIDIDWEYPGSSSAGIVSSPNDRSNFTLLVKGLREALGNDRLLTYASDAGGKYVDWSNVIQYLDFVNVMVYDLGRPPYHNAALYPSGMSRFSAKQAIDAVKSAGVPINKIVLGVPFYGHGATAMGFPDYVNFEDLYKYKQYEQNRDPIAMVPYLVNSNGEMILTYDDEESLRLKCEYVLNNGLLGVMYWEYKCDDDDETLTRLVYETIMDK